MPFWRDVRDELGRWRQALFEAPLYGLLVLALVGSLGAFQARQAQFIDVGGIHDDPYLGFFHDPEPDRHVVPDPEEDFRWTRDLVNIELLGMGRQALEVRLRMQAYRPANMPAPQISLRVGETLLFASPVEPRWHVYRMLLPAQLLADGNLYLDLYADTFQPVGDARELGVSLDWIEVRPIGLGWVGPAWVQVGSFLGAALLAYLLLRRWGLAPAWAASFGALGVGLLTYLLARHRLSLTYFTPTLLFLLAWGCLLTALFLPLLERWRQREGGGLAEARLLWAILLLGALLRLGGMRYPQFRSSDLIFHAHRAGWVGAGDLLFTADLPDINLPAPYPPGLYVTLLPASLLVQDMPLLMQIGGVALDAACGLILYFLARRLSGRPRLALLALLLQQAAPVTYLIYSWGNYTNLFSRTALLVAVALLCLGRWYGGHRREWVSLVGVFGLVFLGHFADSLLLVMFALVVAGLGLLLPSRHRGVSRIMGPLLVAGGLALGLYYTASPGWEALLGLVRWFLQSQGRPAGLINPWWQFLDHVQAPLALLALPGLVLLYQRVGSPRGTEPGGASLGRRWSAAVLGGALLTAGAFGAGQALFGFSSRYSLFVLPVLALGTAGMLVPLWKRGWAGRLVLGVLLGYLLWNCLSTWHGTIGFGQR